MIKCPTCKNGYSSLWVVKKFPMNLGTEQKPSWQTINPCDYTDKLILSKSYCYHCYQSEMRKILINLMEVPNVK